MAGCLLKIFSGSISNIDDIDPNKCADIAKGKKNKVISGVVGAASSVTSIQVANLLRLFKIPQVSITHLQLTFVNPYELLCQNVCGIQNMCVQGYKRPQKVARILKMKFFNSKKTDRLLLLLLDGRKDGWLFGKDLSNCGTVE